MLPTNLEYRDGVDKPLYHCKRPVLRLEAENALLDYLDGIETWKHRCYGNGGLGTRMCVLVASEDYEKAKKVVL